MAIARPKKDQRPGGRLEKPRVHIGVLAFGIIVALQSVFPWTPDQFRLFAILMGIAFIVAAFPGYGFLFKPRKLWADYMDSLPDDDEDKS